MKLKKLIKSILTIVILLIAISSNAQLQKTPGEVLFSFTTVTANGNYAPRHVLAVWVEDESGFIKSRLVQANNRKQYLYTWKTASNFNETDAVTGATLNSHQSHEVVWDCTDLDGMEVSDGTYMIRIEFTDKHAQGPLYEISFEKGGDEQHLAPPDQTYFKEIQLDYYPETTGVSDQSLENELLIYPNPGKNIFYINHLPGETSEIIIRNSAGKIVMSIPYNAAVNKKELKLDLTNFKSGIYVLEFKIGDQIITRKLIKE